MLRKQNVKFTAMLAAAIFLSLCALVGAGVVGYLLLKNAPRSQSAIPTAFILPPDFRLPTTPAPVAHAVGPVAPAAALPPAVAPIAAQGLTLDPLPSVATQPVIQPAPALQAAADPNASASPHNPATQTPTTQQVR
jgi:hypothetical protein